MLGLKRNYTETEQNKKFVQVILNTNPSIDFDHTISEDGIYLIYARNYGINTYVELDVNGTNVATSASPNVKEYATTSCTCIRELKANDVIHFRATGGWYTNNLNYTGAFILKIG